MASSRRGQPPLSVNLPSASPAAGSNGAGTPAFLPDLPPISALFLIDFDVKAGYTIAWKRTIPGLTLDGVVEYKSLPSGLHTVKDDLIYFVHEGEHAGLSAFVNAPCEDEGTRNARMLAVGVLVPLSYGRLGRAWRHAEALKDMAGKLAEDHKDTAVLEAYWERSKAKDAADKVQERAAAETPLASPSVTFGSLRPPQRGHNRKRSASDGMSLLPPGHKLSPYHPAWSLTNLLDTFGPLIFPIHRAALLRKRILISCHAPVHEVNNFVYDISVLSNVPLSVADVLAPPAQAQRLRPLFTIGVHDIPFLMEDLEASKRQNAAAADEAVAEDAGSGWIACTTDSILAMKDTLWDMLITMPPVYAAAAKDKVWPTVECPRGTFIKATQRDLRRYLTLRAGLSRLSVAQPTPAPDSPRSETSASGFRLSTGMSATLAATEDPTDSLEKIVAPLSWAALAYNGFMWWASAGEQGRTGEGDEAARDAALLADLAPPSLSRTPSMTMPTLGAISRTTALAATSMIDSVSSLNARRTDSDDEAARIELAIIAYFHRLTSQMLSCLADAVEAADEDTSVYGDEVDDEEVEDVLLHPGEESLEGRGVRVDSRVLDSMGLDVWSVSDAEFVKELVTRYFSRQAYIEGKGVEVCGVRVC